MSTEFTKQEAKKVAAFAKACRHTIISMLKQSQSGHPGGSLGCIDYLSLLYTQIIRNTGEKVVVSNGHISPAVYAVLAELGYIDKQEVIEGFRHSGSVYEGHVTRHVPGVWFGTGPLGVGVSAAAGFALAAKKQGSTETVYALIGDGEAEEGQVYEMMHSAAKEQLDNFVVFMDYNQVQLSGALATVMPYRPDVHFAAAGWDVLDVDGHDLKAMWNVLKKAKKRKKPVLILGKTIMGKGVSFMEVEGAQHKATWHGSAPTPQQADKALAEVALSDEEQKLAASFRGGAWQPRVSFPDVGDIDERLRVGFPRVYGASEHTDCRTAYGNALLDLAKENKEIIALTADLAASVKTNILQKEFPERHVDVGIAEQHMVSMSGGLSLGGLVPFCSTFGVFMTSRAKDQARVNDLNQTNVKMVATHCGLSVGEDGPTHQAIDDMGSFLGFFHTEIMEPADPNHCDRMIRYAASHYGNMYVRMGRAKLPVLTHEDGSIFFDKTYVYEYGKSEILRSGSAVTIVASGPMVHEALAARESLDQPELVEIIIASTPGQFDETLLASIRKTKKVITVEDHNAHTGLGTQLASALVESGVGVETCVKMGADSYQLSGSAEDLYDAAGLSARHIVQEIQSLLS